MRRVFDWPTTIAVVPFLVILLLLREHALSVDDALKLLAALGAYLALVSNSKGSAK